MINQKAISAILVVSLGCAAVVLQGCVALAFGAGVGTAAYVTGQLEDYRPESLDDVRNATVQAMNDLEFSVTSTEKDALSSTVVARDARDRRIRVRLNRTEQDTTKITIRVGTFGDEEASRTIYQRITENIR